MPFNFTCAGSGPDLILIHGLGGNLQMWDEVAPVLEKRFTVWRYDLRGHGQAENPPGPWELDNFIEDLKNFVDINHLRRFSLVGFSLGGLISQGFTLRYPDVVEKLVILSAVADRTEQERKKVVERVRNLESGDLDTNIDLALERWFSPEFRASSPDKVKMRLDALKANDPTGYLNAYRVFSFGDLGNQLHNITCPTLVMTGEFDPGSNVRMSEFMHNHIAGSRLEILPNLRHSVLVEAPAMVAEKLNSFL